MQADGRTMDTIYNRENLHAFFFYQYQGYFIIGSVQNIILIFS